MNWQKSYGLELITSDKFHANIGIFTNICNGVLAILIKISQVIIHTPQVCRILWGLLYDRLGYRKCFLVIGALVSAGIASLPLLKYLGGWLGGIMATTRTFLNFI